MHDRGNLVVAAVAMGWSRCCCGLTTPVPAPPKAMVDDLQQQQVPPVLEACMVHTKAKVLCQYMI